MSIENDRFLKFFLLGCAYKKVIFGESAPTVKKTAGALIYRYNRLNKRGLFQVRVYTFFTFRFASYVDTQLFKRFFVHVRKYYGRVELRAF